MDAQSIIIFIVVGIVAGWIAGMVVRGGGFGLIGDLVVGVIGAVIAGWLLPRVGLTINVGGAIVSSIISGAIGAIILLLVVHQEIS